MILYNLAISGYAAIVKLAAHSNPKARAWVEGRRGVLKRMAQEVTPTDKTAWFHAASLGEFEQGRPLIEAFKKQYPTHKIVLTFFSPSGYEVRKNYAGAHYIYYLPIDTPKNANLFLDAIHPDVAIFIKYEFWFNYLNELKRRGIKCYVVSAIFRPTQLFFKSYGGAYRRFLRLFSHIFVQNAASQTLLNSIGVNNVTVCGDTRFDRVIDITNSAPKNNPIVEWFTSDSRVVIGGSTWPADDKIMVELAKSHPNLKFLIAPHELGEQKIAELNTTLKKFGFSTIRYTQKPTMEQAKEARVLILDTIGILSGIYRYGFCAYIGGGFGVGIHNTLEAATFGLPLAFGPNYQRFKEAVDLVLLGAATPINNREEAQLWLDILCNNSAQLATQSQKAEQYVKDNSGACKMILDHKLI